MCGYNVDNKNPQTKRSPLHDAVIAQDFTMVEILLSAGAKPSMRDAQNITILESAVMKGNYDMVYLLLLHGAKITNHHIHMAQKQNYQTIAQLLTYVKQYRHKLFEKTTYNKSGYPPLHQALIDQDEQRLDALLIINAPIHHKNAYGKTALELALDLKCNENIMKKLCLRDARLLI